MPVIADIHGQAALPDRHPHGHRPVLGREPDLQYELQITMAQCARELEFSISASLIVEAQAACIELSVAWI